MKKFMLKAIEKNNLEVMNLFCYYYNENMLNII